MTADNPSLRYPRFWWALGFIWVVILLYACLSPRAAVDPGVPGFDKFLHFAVFAGLAGWFGALTRHGSYIRVFAGLLGLGAAIEWLQGLTGYRDANLWDLFADGLGVCAGLVLARQLGLGTLRYIERHVAAIGTGAG